MTAAAITAARAATKTLSTKITNWLSSGAEGPLFTKQEFKDLLKNVSDEALRASLAEINQNQLGDYQYDPREFNEDPVGLTSVPQWAQVFAASYKKFIDDPFPQNDVGRRELTGFRDANFNIKPEFTSLYDAANEVIYYAIPLADCSVLRLTTDGTGNPVNYSISGDFSSSFDDTGFNFTTPTVQTQTLTATVTSTTDSLGNTIQQVEFTDANGNPAEYQVYEEASWSCGFVNPQARQIARNVINRRNESLSDILESSFEIATGVNVRDFINDTKVAYNNQDPYYFWELLGEDENNPAGTEFAYANRVEKEIHQQLKDTELDFTSPGILPDVKCKEEQTITYPDGSKEKICAKGEVLTPAAAVSGLAQNVLSTSLDSLEGTDTWQEVLFTSAIQLTGAALEGGLNYISNEITAAEAEGERVGITGLGVFDNLGIGLNNPGDIDENAWQRIADKNVDFSELDQFISHTLDEAQWKNWAAGIMREMPLLYATADQHFVMGPDYKWEKRIRDEARQAWQRLEEDVAKNSDEDQTQTRSQTKPAKVC